MDLPMMYSEARRNLIARRSGEDCHDYAQVLIGWRGRMSCRFDDSAGRLVSGNAALVPACAAHLYEGLTDDSELLVLDVSLSDPAIIALEAACELSIRDTLFQRPEIVTLDAQAMPLLAFASNQLQRPCGPGSALVSYQLVSLFMAQLCDLYLAGNPPLQAGARLDVTALNRIIDDRLDAPLSNAELAAAMHLSESHFYLLFQRQFGMAPQQYVMSRRLQRAHELLHHSSMPLAELALEVGFADASSFSRAFKKHFCDTPGSARRAFKGLR